MMRQKYYWGIRGLTFFYCMYMLIAAKSYHFMALNVLLAYIPIEISFHFKKAGPRLFILLSFLWLLFYPNAPYLFTDFFHLELLPIYQGMDQLFGLTLSGWWAFSLLTAGICVWGFWGMNTLFTVISNYRERKLLNRDWQGAVLVLLINLLSGLAIYVGRFDRLHSVYLFIRPIDTLKTIFLNWSMEKLGFILLFTGLQFVLLFAIKGTKLMDAGSY